MGKRMASFFALALLLSLLGQPVQAVGKTKYVALTFDDGPSGKYTNVLLDGLFDRGVKATFVLCGYRMKDYPELTQRIFDQGHEIALHGYSHKNMRSMSRRDIVQELNQVQFLLPQGCVPAFLRPPGGAISDAVRQVAQARNLGILAWSVDPRDWASSNTEAIEKAVLKSVADGDIILLHDMTESSVKAALDIVDTLMEEDFELVTVSEMARLRGVDVRPGRVYARMPGLDSGTEEPKAG